MFQLAYRQLRLEAVRTLLTSFALGDVFAVILVLGGFELGQYAQLQKAVLDRGADLIVAQAGVSNMIAVRSTLPQLSRRHVEAVDGVSSAHPLTALPVIYEHGEEKTPLYLLVFDSLGGPPQIWKGRSIQEEREIIIDVALARKYGMSPGDNLEIADFEFIIAGVTQNTAAFFMPFIFVSYDTLIDFYLESDVVADLSTFPLLSFLLIELAPNADPEVVAQRIELSVESVDVFTPQQMAMHDENMGRGILGPIMGLLVIVAYIIGLLVVGLIMHADVSSRIRSFGVLKALGFDQRMLSKAVFIQTLLLLLIAFPLGIFLAIGLATFIHWAMPLYLVLVTEPVLLMKTLFAGFVFAFIGAIAPVRLIAHVDPLLVFQGG